MKLKSKTNSGLVFENKKKQQIHIWEDASGNIVVESKTKGGKFILHKVFVRDAISLEGDNSEE
jgi:hypothetical protein